MEQAKKVKLSRVKTYQVPKQSSLGIQRNSNLLDSVKLTREHIDMNDKEQVKDIQNIEIGKEGRLEKMNKI